MEIVKKQDWEKFNRVLNENGVKYFFHFTDKENIESIDKTGYLCSWEYCLKNNIKIPRQGGNDLSMLYDLRNNLQNYVRLSFITHHPMAFVALKEGRLSTPIVLHIKKEVAFWESTQFCNMNAASSKESKVIGDKISDLKSVKFEIVKKRYRYLDQLIKPYHQAEILVKEKIPIDYIVDFHYLEQ